MTPRQKTNAFYRYCITALAFFAMGLSIPDNDKVRVSKDGSTGTEAVAGMEDRGKDRPYFFYTVGDEVKCYLDGKPVSIEAYQTKLGMVSVDGKPGWHTCRWTTFFNGQDEMMGYNK